MIKYIFIDIKFNQLEKLNECIDMYINDYMNTYVNGDDGFVSEYTVLDVHDSKIDENSMQIQLKVRVRVFFTKPCINDYIYDLKITDVFSEGICLSNDTPIKVFIPSKDIQISNYRIGDVIYRIKIIHCRYNFSKFEVIGQIFDGCEKI